MPRYDDAPASVRQFVARFAAIFRKKIPIFMRGVPLIVEQKALNSADLSMHQNMHDPHADDPF
jgi:hypothetical protein